MVYNEPSKGHYPCLPPVSGQDIATKEGHTSDLSNHTFAVSHIQRPVRETEDACMIHLEKWIGNKHDMVMQSKTSQVTRKQDQS
jgi:hypothetical protein